MIAKTFQSRRSGLTNRVWLAFLLMAGIAAIYLPSLAGPFFLDDDIYVTGNAALQKAAFWQVFTERLNIYEFLPFRDLTYWLDWKLFGPSPIPYRLHNWLWYGAACGSAGFAAFHLASLLGLKEVDARQLGLLVAVLFLVNPLHVESVAWIAGRKDIMAGTFAFLSIGFWVRALREQNSRLGGVSLALYVLAIFSKTPTMVLPAIIVLLWWCHAPNRKQPALLLLLLGFALACAASFAMSVGNANDVGVLSVERANTPWSTRIPFALRILGESVRRSVLPFDLRLIYDHLFMWYSSPASWLAVALGMATCGGAVFALKQYRSSPTLLAFGAIWFCVFMLPYLQLMPFKALSPFSDRYTFVGSLGLALVWATILQRMPTPATRRNATLAIVLILALLAGWRSMDWRSMETLVAKEARTEAGASGALGLAITRLYLPQNRFDEALAAASRIRIDEERLAMLLNIENQRAYRQGSDDSYRAFLQRAIRENQATVVYSMGLATSMSDSCVRLGLLNEAEMLYRAMLANDTYAASTKGDVMHNLGLVMQKRGSYDDALAIYRDAATMPSRSRVSRAVSWTQVGRISAALQRAGDAEQAFVTALDLDPRNELAARNLASLRSITRR